MPRKIINLNIKQRPNNFFPQNNIPPLSSYYNITSNVPMRSLSQRLLIELFCLVVFLSIFCKTFLRQVYVKKGAEIVVYFNLFTTYSVPYQTQ